MLCLPERLTQAGDYGIIKQTRQTDPSLILKPIYGCLRRER